MFHLINLQMMRKRIKKFQFDVSSQSCVIVRAESLKDAISVFEVTFGEFLFNQVNCIWEV